MSVSAIDSRIFRNIFGTCEIRNVFADEAYVRNMLNVEAALARAQSRLNVIPGETGDAITRACKDFKVDWDRFSHETEIVGYPVLPLTRQLVECMRGSSASKYVHYGATTQDIMDTASILQLQEGLVIVRRQLTELSDILAALARKHQATPMAGRTHLQHALPCTFGYKCALYLSGMKRHVDRLTQIEQRCLLVSFGGAAGTLASLGSDDTGLRVREELAIELGLAYDPATWHSIRDNIAEILNFLALIGGSLGKIALDIMVMSSNELGEVSEPFVPHRGASSTMPQKRNPISSEVILAASKLLRSNASLGLDAMVVDFERASGPWHLEWVAIPESFVYAVGALHQACFALGGLVVNTKAMMTNLCSTKGLIVGEAVMMGLAPSMGRQKAHDLVYAACKQAIESDATLLDVLMKDTSVIESINDAELARLCDPTEYLGASKLMVVKILEASGTSA